MKQTFFHLLLLCVLSFTMNSCQTKEEHVLSGLNRLSDQIVQRGDTYSNSDWENFFSEYEQLHKEAMECEFTQEQLTELGRLEGKLTTIMTKEGARKIGQEVQDYIKNGKTILEGFIQGVTESNAKD